MWRIGVLSGRQRTCTTDTNPIQPIHEHSLVHRKSVSCLWVTADDKVDVFFEKITVTAGYQDAALRFVFCSCHTWALLWWPFSSSAYDVVGVRRVLRTTLRTAVMALENTGSCPCPRHHYVCPSSTYSRGVLLYVVLLLCVMTSSWSLPVFTGTQTQQAAVSLSECLKFDVQLCVCVCVCVCMCASILDFSSTSFDLELPNFAPLLVLERFWYRF